MQTAIPSLVPNVVLTGLVNAGKSSLINAMTRESISIVSEQAGTTSDPIKKRFELLGVGAINLIDTAGFGDTTHLSHARYQKSIACIQEAHLVLHIIDAQTWHIFDQKKDLSYVTKKSLLVFSKIDLISPDEEMKLREQYPQALCVSVENEASIEALLKAMANQLHQQTPLLLDGIKLAYPLLVHVIPIDSEAPKGRLILPQMQLLREALDLHLTSVVLQVEELATYLTKHQEIGLIVTDSQAFKEVSAINTKRHPLTSYSILQARQKGDFSYFLQSLEAIAKLPNPAEILMMESCSHNVNHEDIGRIKIPKLLQKLLPHHTLNFHFFMGQSFPQSLETYDLIIHCGSCMLPAITLQQRTKQAQLAKIPMLNYGLFLAHANHIVEEAIAVFSEEYP